jgi:RNA recognition motif-containing protein
MALDAVHRATKAINKRRERERQEQAAVYTAYHGATATESETASTANVGSPGAGKRKLNSLAEGEMVAENSAKRHKNELDESAGAGSPVVEQQKRDREHSTIIVFNLPATATQTRVRQYFKEYGHVNNITAFVREDGGNSTTALIEFSSPEEARSALLRDMKYFGESQIQVQPGDRLTVYAANYPPAADEKYIRGLFQDCGPILSIRWPSLKVNTHRRFCYVSFRDEEAAAKAVKKDGTILEKTYKLLSKYSDPGRKKNREGAVAEGREVHITNIDPSATDASLKEVFAKYGNVTRVNRVRAMSGKARGFAFIDFETKEQAEEAALQVNNTKFQHQILQVEVSKPSKVKATARSNPMQDADGDSTITENGSSEQWRPAGADILARSISLMGFPDTVNDARVLALVEPFGKVVKLTLQPSRGGAIIEFADAATAGKAALHLDATEYEGHQLRTGAVDELRHLKAGKDGENAGKSQKDTTLKSTRGSVSAQSSFMPPPSSVRRPTAGRTGPKRGLGFAPRKAASSSTSQNESTNKVGRDGNAAIPKSNADFKAMFLESGDEGKGRNERKEEPNQN